VAVSVVRSPQQSVVALLGQVADGQNGGPVSLLAAVRDALRPQAWLAAQSVSGRGWLPQSCAPIRPVADVSVADQAARLRDMPAAALEAEFQAAFGSRGCPPRWRAAADQPRRWLNSMADASLDTWAVAEPWWRAAGPLLDCEIRRVGTAAVRGGMAALLNSLDPRLSYHDGTFSLPSYRRDQGVIHHPVGARRLALVPMIAGPERLIVNFDPPDVCVVGYPLRPCSPDAQATAGSPLATILGPVRAAMLRALRQPLTVSDLAAAVYCAPNTATHHLRQLAAADLISREKSGVTVWVSRTVRGDELVDLLSA
jgi:DNA-binding transcriptional ArsR family regulator